MASEVKDSKKSYSKIFRRIRNTVSGGSSASLESKDKQPKIPGSPKGHRKEQSDQLLPMSINNSQQMKFPNESDGSGPIESLVGKAKPSSDAPIKRSDTISIASTDDGMQLSRRLAPSFSNKSGLGDIGDEGSITDLSILTPGELNTTLGRFSQRFPTCDKFIESILDLKKYSIVHLKRTFYGKDEFT